MQYRSRLLILMTDLFLSSILSLFVLYIWGLCSWKWKLLSHVQLFATLWAIQSIGQNTGVGSIPFSRESSQPRDWTQHAKPPCPLPTPPLQADSLPAEPWGKPWILEWVAYPFSRDLPDPGIEWGSWPFCVIYLGALFLGAYNYVFLINWSSCQCKMFFFVPDSTFCLDVYTVWY